MIDPRSALSAAFAKTILSRENRPIRLRWSQRETHFEELLLVQRVEIREAMNEGMHGHLTCISIDPDLPLHELLGQALGIEMINDRGGLHHINGIITEARAGQADGALRVYHLTLRDAMSIMDGRINSRIFRRKSVPDILHVLLREWRLRSPALAHAFSFDLHRLDQRRYAFWALAAEMGSADAQAYLGAKLTAARDNPKGTSWANSAIGYKMLECAYAQENGNGASELGRRLDLPEQQERSLRVYHEGVKFGSKVSANHLTVEFRGGLTSDGPRLDLDRAERYSAINDMLHLNPDLRLPNLDKVLPLPPAVLPYWDGEKESLIDGAKPVKTVSLDDIKPSPASLREGRAHILKKMGKLRRIWA